MTPEFLDILKLLLPRYEWVEGRGWFDTQRVPVFVTHGVVLRALIDAATERGWVEKIIAHAIAHHRERAEATAYLHSAYATLELYCDMIRELRLLEEVKL